MANSFWRVAEVVTLGRYRIDFMSLTEDANSFNQMNDCIRPNWQAAGKYKVIFRNAAESDAASPVLSLDTTKNFGNEIYRRLIHAGSGEAIDNLVVNLIAAAKIANINFYQLWPGKFTGYFDGNLHGQKIPTNTREFINSTPVLAATM